MLNKIYSRLKIKKSAQALKFIIYYFKIIMRFANKSF